MPRPGKSENKQIETRTMRVGDLVLAAGGLQFTEDEGDEQHTPVELVVRSHSPVSTFMGPIIHDHSGVFHKDKVPLDWVHGSDRPEEILGFLDKVVHNNEEVRCSGEIVSVTPGDIADRVVKQMKAGIPYESSISFGGQGLVMEEVGENTNVDVNGKKFSGPGIVVRKWPLRSVAICPHGADNQTSTSLAFSEEKIPVTITSYKENEMSEGKDTSSEDLKTKEAEKAKLEAKELEVKKAEELKIKEEKEKAKLAEEQVKTELVSSDGKSGMEFIKAFGSDGAIWFTEGKSFAEAGTLYTQKLEKRVVELEKRIKAADLGGKDSVNFEDDEETEKTKLQEKTSELAGKIGPGLAKFAASLKLRK